MELISITFTTVVSGAQTVVVTYNILMLPFIDNLILLDQCNGHYLGWLLL